MSFINTITDTLGTITTPRNLSVLVVTGVPAIIGGGLLYWITGEHSPQSYYAVALYEVLLYTAAIITAAKVK